MKTPMKLVIVALLAVGVVAAVILKQNKPAVEATTGDTPQLAANLPPDNSVTNPLPRLVDLGADKCIPCKKMAPILEELKKEYAGRMKVDFIDVWKNPDAGETYQIRLIPTQIFFDSAGKELFRHEGFFGKEDILAKWKELGVLTK